MHFAYTMYAFPNHSMAQSSIQVRIDKKLKEKAEAVLASLGLDSPTAIRIFYAQIVMTGSIPFALRQEEDHFTERQLLEIDKAYKESLDPKNLSPAYTSADDLIAALRS